MFARSFAQALLALALLAASEAASAGRVHPELEKRLSQKAAEGDLTPVIVELEERVSPSAASAGAPQRDRHARGRAVVKALKDTAERTQGPIRAQLAQENAADARNVQPLWVVNAIALEANEKVIRKLANRPDVREVRTDRSIPAPKPHATVKPKSGGAPTIWNLDKIRAPEVWALGHSGTGIVVGSFDTGVDGTHPDLIPNYRGNHAISWFDPYNQHDEPYDNNGHGTHTTGTMVASGEFSGFRIGVAPGARWIAAKGWRDNDNATASAFHMIFQWFLAPGGDPANAPDIVNSSWGMDPPSCDPEFVADVAALRAAGIVPVFSSGNSGPDPSTTLAPGSYPGSFTVGATDLDDEIAEFSSQGPSQCDGAVKPNVSAPGVAILSTLPGGLHFELDGTSMAAPHVSGAAAVLRSIVPTLTVEEIEAAIVDGSIDQGIPGPDNEFGAGRLDLLQSASVVLGIPLVSIESTTAAAEAGLVTGRFTVRRKGSTTNALVLPYTVGGTASAGTDYVALPGSVTIPAGAASAVIDVTPLDDALVELTETVVVTLTANPAYLASPAQATINLTSDEIPPDLVVSAFTAPGSGGAGSALTLNETTRNQGAAGSEASTTGYYISANAVFDASDTLLGTRAVPALAPGASSSGSVTVTLPASLTTGTWYLLAKADHADLLVETQEGNNVSYSTLLVGSDLQVSVFTTPTDGGAGLPLAITETTRNAAAGTAAATTTSYYLSVDGTLDAGDTLLGSRAVPSLAAGATHTASLSITIPAGTGTGTYMLFARADSGAAVAEVYENNNTRANSLRIGPDLGVTSFIAPTTAGIGESFSVTETTRNTGGGTAAASTTRYYLSTNGLVDAGDVPLGSRAIASLAPGATQTGSAVVTIPAGTSGGSYYLIAAADADGVIAETQESNNVTNRMITVGSDLYVLTFTAPTDAGAGLAISISDTTRNQGTGTAPASTTSFYLSTDATFDASDVLLGSRAIPALAGNSSNSSTISVTIPAAAVTGNYTLFARADAGDVVPEAVETNNLHARTLRIGPDFQVTSLTAPTASGAGASITVGDTTRNAGAGNTPASTTRIYLSTDFTLDAGDTLLASRAVPPLGPGASSTGSVTATIPATTPGGTYYVIAMADGDNAVAETQEGNNTMSRSLLIGPDLGMLSLTAPADSGAGLAIAIVDQTRNTGGGTAPATTTSFYLSTDTTLDAGDVLLGSRAVPELAAGTSSTGTTTVTVPAGTATGSYTLFARADAGDAVPETYENNNTTSRTLRVGPDLTVESLTVPTSAGAGTTISVQDSVRNVGGGASTAAVVRYYLSTDGLPGGGDIELGSRTLPAIAPSTSNPATTSLTIPAGTAGGNYYVVAVADADGAVAETTESNNFTNRPMLVGTDLIVSVFTAPSDAGAGLPLTIGDTTRNQGAGTAPATGTSYYLSLNATLDATDTLLGTRSVASLGPGASDSGSLGVTIPAGTTTGTWYLIAKADSGDAVAEVTESNNASSRTLRIGPDLVVPAITAPASAGAGDTVSITVTTQNTGGGAAAASSTQVYLSTDWIFSAGDTLLATRDVASLAPGASDVATLSVTLPAGLAGGTHYLIAVADGGAAVVETQEGNNATYRGVLVGSDLQISSFTVPTAGGAGLGLALVETTRNAGAGTTPASTTTYYLSTDSTLDASDTVLGTHAVPPLGPGATDTANITVTLPAVLAVGTHYVFARADSGGVVSETYENNNVTSRAVSIGPDMNVASLAAPSSVAVGSSLVVTDTTRNTGGGAAPATTTRYYLSSNTLPDAGDLLLGSRVVPALGPATTDVASVTLTIPAGTATGFWYLIAVADGDAAVAETNETNNLVFRGLTVNP